VSLVGCASVQGAVDGAQQAVDGAQALLEAPQRIAGACADAVTALEPGTPAADAQEAMRGALAQLDEALGDAAAIPGVADVREAFVSAVESLGTQADTTATQASREAITAACAIVTGGTSS
jgi:hypothetical protein